MSLSQNTQNIVVGFTTDIENLTEVNSVLQTPRNIAISSVTSYQKPSKYLDEELLSGPILSDIQLINEKKERIVEISDLIISSYVPGFSPPIVPLRSSINNLDTTIISETGTRNSRDGGNPAFGGSGLPGQETPRIAYATVRSDELRSFRAPNLEKQIAPNNNSLDGLKYPVLSGDNTGQGKENIIFENGQYEDPDTGIVIYTWDAKGNWSNIGWVQEGETLGRYYEMQPNPPAISEFRVAGIYDDLTGSYTIDTEYTKAVSKGITGITTGVFQAYSTGDPPTPVGIAITCQYNPQTSTLVSENPFFPGLFFPIPAPSGPGYFTFNFPFDAQSLYDEVETLKSEIISLRVGLSTYLESVNIIKAKKHSEQLKVWTYTRINNENEEEIDQVGIARTTVVQIDPNLPVSSITFDTGETFDSTEYTMDSF
jgi:hypothetical protein